MIPGLGLWVMLVVISLLFGPSNVRASNAEIHRTWHQVQEDIGKARSAKNPVEAARLWGQAAKGLDLLEREGIRNPTFYLNQGKVNLLADLLPQAIRALRSGLKLAPNDTRLKETLEYARGLVQYPPPGNRGRPPVEVWPPWLPRPGVPLLLGLTFCFYSLAWIGATRWYMVRKTPLLVWAGISLMLSILTGTGWFCLDTQARAQAEFPALVIAQNKVAFLRGNGSFYPPQPDLPSLHRGMEARRLYQRGNWLQIQFATGEVGWVEKTAVLEIP